MQLRRSLSVSPDQRGRKETEYALKMANLHLAKLRNIYGKSVLLADKKRNWRPNDGYFISRGVDKTKLVITSRFSDAHSYESNMTQFDDREDQNWSISSNILGPDRSFDGEENYLRTSITNESSPHQTNESESMEIAPLARPTTEIVPVDQDPISINSGPVLGPKVTRPAAEERGEIEKNLCESERTDEMDLVERKPNLTLLKVQNQINERGDPVVIDLTLDEDEEENENSMETENTSSSSNRE